MRLLPTWWGEWVGLSTDPTFPSLLPSFFPPKYVLLWPAFQLFCKTFFTEKIKNAPHRLSPSTQTNVKNDFYVSFSFFLGKQKHGHFHFNFHSATSFVFLISSHLTIWQVGVINVSGFNSEVSERSSQYFLSVQWTQSDYTLRRVSSNRSWKRHCYTSYGIALQHTDEE